MITESSLQPAAALIFFTGGAAVFVFYELLKAVRFSKRLPVFAHITDGAFTLAAALFFIGLTHFFFEGKIKYFTVFNYIAGFFVARLTIRPPLCKLTAYLKKLYKSRRAIDTKDTGGDDNGQYQKSKAD